MDALNNLVYVVSGQAGTEHVVCQVFRSYEKALAYKDICDKRWFDKGWRHFITVSHVED